MQRLIKFRAYDTKNKKWLDEVPPEEYMLDNDDCWDAPDYGEMCEALSFYPQNPLGSNFNGRIVYQQFTGLLDKNGKEIYEGDIIERRGIKEVEFLSGDDCDFQGFDIDQVFGKWEIIGNIFETPELLK